MERQQEDPVDVLPGEVPAEPLGLVGAVPSDRSSCRDATLFVAGFLGLPGMNLVELPVIDGGVRFGDSMIRVPCATLTDADTTTVMVGVRPENLAISNAGLKVEVDVVEELGADAYVYGRAAVGGASRPIVTRVDWRNLPAKGETIDVVPVDDTGVHVFSTTTGERLG
ncbi:MAG: TOBE domain-containing protein [Aeromicrobium sp.]